jgi:Cof subfamily protein (haloacid dehalogenase superfamily)
MIRLFVSDLDNTLLNHEKTVDDANRAALRQLAGAGVELCLASGRMDKELIQLMDGIVPRFHRISQNGAFIYTCEGKCLQSVHFEGTLARQLYEEAAPFGLAGFISVEDRMFAPRFTLEIREISERMILPLEERPNVLEEIGSTLFPSKLCFFGSMDKIKALMEHLERKFAGQLDMFISDKDCLDLMPRNISKGSALLRLMKKLNLEPEEVACIGDSYNDVSMFRVAGHSFAMNVADNEVKKEAGRVVNSVAEAIEFILEYNRLVVK